MPHTHTGLVWIVTAPSLCSTVYNVQKIHLYKCATAFVLQEKSGDIYVREWPRGRRGELYYAATAECPHTTHVTLPQLAVLHFSPNLATYHNLPILTQIFLLHFKCTRLGLQWPQTCFSRYKQKIQMEGKNCQSC